MYVYIGFVSRGQQFTYSSACLKRTLTIHVLAYASTVIFAVKCQAGKYSFHGFYSEPSFLWPAQVAGLPLKSNLQPRDLAILCAQCGRCTCSHTCKAWGIVFHEGPSDNVSNCSSTYDHWPLVFHAELRWINLRHVSGAWPAKSFSTPRRSTGHSGAKAKPSCLQVATW